MAGEFGSIERRRKSGRLAEDVPAVMVVGHPEAEAEAEAEAAEVEAAAVASIAAAVGHKVAGRHLRGIGIVEIVGADASPAVGTSVMTGAVVATAAAEAKVAEVQAERAAVAVAAGVEPVAVGRATTGRRAVGSTTTSTISTTDETGTVAGPLSPARRAAARPGWAIGVSVGGGREPQYHSTCLRWLRGAPVVIAACS